LPTEAEWEYACRAGTTTPFSTGSNITTNQANYNGNNPYNNNAKGTYREKTTAVGSFAANPWGLYDMHGNVWEWCWDKYGSEAQTDPLEAFFDAGRVRRGGSWDILVRLVVYWDRVIRGGSWFNNGELLRSAFRGYNTQSDYDYNLGFRLVRPSL
jgi:formylglycine-generating enzyme required for sulfatase activity